jgi:hypothetical protein
VPSSCVGGHERMTQSGGKSPRPQNGSELAPRDHSQVRRPRLIAPPRRSRRVARFSAAPRRAAGAPVARSTLLRDRASRCQLTLDDLGCAGLRQIDINLPEPPLFGISKQLCHSGVVLGEVLPSACLLGEPVEQIGYRPPLLSRDLAEQLASPTLSSELSQRNSSHRLDLHGGPKDSPFPDVAGHRDAQGADVYALAHRLN